MAAKKARRPTTRAASAGARAAKNTAARSAPRNASARPAAPKPVAKAPAAPSGVPNAIGASRLHLDYTSHDVPGIKRFYTQILGFTRVDEDPKMGYLSIQTTPTTGLGFMAPMPGPPEQWRPPGEPALYFVVKDVDRVHKDLQAKGVEFQQPPTDMPWGHRMAVCRDPEGRMVCLAQEPSRG
jgi:predicted enzyme related to lactoylglutathione lyase